MPIWEHRGVWRDKPWLAAAWNEIKNIPKCLYCSKQYLEHLHIGERCWRDKRSYLNRYDTVFVCSACGWWFAVKRVYETVYDGEMWSTLHGNAGNLFLFDSAEYPEAIVEARKQLSIDWSKSKHVIHPRVFEDVVASVFKDFGYLARTTGYSDDGGIDIVLERENNVVGVQVKRYKNRIQVDQIRAFAGALLLNGYPKGVFVTTSDYQSGCHTAAGRYRTLGMPIELVNGSQFFAGLGIESRPHYKGWDDLFSDCSHELTRISGVRIN